jgi:predicted regulator of Ras-like GTPase activity (Roadblock/LC7/MglB family)
MEQQLLSALRRAPGVTAAYVVSDEGPLAGTTGDEVTALHGALLAATVGALRQAAADLGLGGLGELILEADGGGIVAQALPGGRVAVVIADSKANYGLIRVELRRLRRG